MRHRLKYIEPNPQTFSLHNVLLLDSASISRLSSIGISNAENTQPLLEMRLIDTATFQLKEFPDERNVTYAILSHRWEEGEVLFNNMMSHDALQKAKTMKGFYKVEKCCRQAASEGIQYAWVDTCCIDKSSSAELQEAINSMYRWYQNSVVCYAYLSDVVWHTSQPPEIGASLWFKRGWTLQELLAPKSVIFYSSDWSELGSRLDLAQSIRQNTRLPYRCLNGGFKADGNTPIAEIMSWARERETTRIEDRAYSLLGLFNVYMPMLYGEGVRAFTRLQEELLRQSGDQSIFAWEGISLHHSGLLADSPDCFPPFEAYDRCEKSRRRASSVTSEGITAEFILLPYSPHMHLAILNYELKFHNDHSFPSRKIYGIFLREVDHRSRFCRVHPRRKHL